MKDVYLRVPCRAFSKTRQWLSMLCRNMYESLHLDDRVPSFFQCPSLNDMIHYLYRLIAHCLRGCLFAIEDFHSFDAMHMKELKIVQDSDVRMRLFILYTSATLQCRIDAVGPQRTNHIYIECQT